MQLRKPVALGENLQNAFGVLNEVRIALCRGVSGCLAGKDELQHRLDLLTHCRHHHFTRPFQTNQTEIDLSRQA